MIPSRSEVEIPRPTADRKDISRISRAIELEQLLLRHDYRAIAARTAQRIRREESIH